MANLHDQKTILHGMADGNPGDRKLKSGIIDIHQVNRSSAIPKLWPEECF
jgi:hypothetical protein